MLHFKNYLIIYALFMLKKFYGWYGKRTVYIVLITLVILVGFLIFKTSSSSDKSLIEETPKPTVELSSSAALQSNNSLEVIGVVSAKTQAKLQAEVGGRVLSVNVSLGQVVSPGTIITQLENASQKASLLQAEGYYEAILSQSAQSDISVTEAETRLDSAIDTTRVANQTAFTTISDVLLNNIDQLFSSANSGFIGLRINGRGQTTFLNEERVAFRNILATWNKATLVGNQTPAILSRLQVSKAEVLRLLNLVDILIPLVSEHDNTSSFSDLEIETIAAQLSNARSRLVSVIFSLETAEKAIWDGVDGLAKAKLSASGGNASAMDAQVKQALGSLRSAQANYEKTVVRSPITGTINQLSVRAGDYVGVGAPLAEIANNNGLEITTYIDTAESSQIMIGDVVALGGTASGTVTNISPAVDLATGKIEVRIGVISGNLKAGNTVRVIASKSNKLNNQEIIVPLSAIKLGTNDAFVFIVTEDNKLQTRTVVLGPVSGNQVIVHSGITLDTEIVLDARGLKAGDLVNIRAK